MAQEPLNVLWIEPHFPGRLGATADWLARRRGYRCWFYCHTADPPELRPAPASAGRGLEVQPFGVGGVAREPAVAWSRTLERGLCYSFGCYELLERRRPRPIDLVVGRSCGLGSTLFAPVHAPAAPVVNLFDYHLDPHRHDLTDDDAPSAPPAYFRWRRSANAVDLLDLEQASLAWTPTAWQRSLYPPEYRDDLWVQHDGVDQPEAPPERSQARRSIAGRTVPEGTRVVTFVARTLDRIRGFDRFWHAANELLRARRDIVCVAVGSPVVQRGIDVTFHNRDYPAELRKARPPVDPDRLWLLGPLPPPRVADLLALSDLHLAPGRSYPVARSLLEAMGAGCVVLASDTPPHREVVAPGVDGLLFDPADPEALVESARRVLDDPAAHRPLGLAAAEKVRARYSREVCLPELARRFSALAGARRGGRP